MWQILASLVIALFALIASGRWIVRLLSNITQAFGLSEYSVAFVFLAVATSIPELFVAISSAQASQGQIVMAVALGSNIVNMTLILGLAAILSVGISTSGINVKRDIYIGGLITVLPILFIMNGVISRFEGSILVLAFCGYMFALYKSHAKPRVSVLPKYIFRGAASFIGIILLIIVLLFAANITVSSSVSLATIIGLPAFLIGLFLLAIGTSLPELTTTLQSAWQKKPTMALGNILGSNVADSALIIGVASIAKPIRMSLDAPYLITAFFVIAALVLVGFLSRSQQKLSLIEGLLLTTCFALFATVMFVVGIPASL